MQLGRACPYSLQDTTPSHGDGHRCCCLVAYATGLTCIWCQALYDCQEQHSASLWKIAVCSGSFFRGVTDICTAVQSLQ